MKTLHDQTELAVAENVKFSAEDYRFMQRAITLAKKAHFTTSPNPRVGCVLVNNGEIIGEGYHQKAGHGHAEVNALKQAQQENKSTEGATAYVTLEPCSHYGRTPPCAEGLIKAKVSHVIIAMVDPNPQVSGNGIALLEQAGIDTKVGLLNADAQALNQGFIHLMTNKIPYVRCKLASSLDGKTAMANGESKWITSPQARQNVQVLRAQSCAVISGVDSVLFDNASMNVRWAELGELKNTYEEQNVRQPVRVIIDPKSKLTPGDVNKLALFSQQSPIVIAALATGSELNNSQAEQWPDFVEHIEVPATSAGKLDLAKMLFQLGKRGLNDILIESGARLAGAFIEQDLVNELLLFQAPKLMGDEGKGLVHMPSIETLSSAKPLSITDVRMVGSDIRITALFKGLC